MITWGDGPPQIVMLHDGLGSVSQWGEVPERIAAATGATVMAYDRPGHGAAEPVPDGPWPVDWWWREADALAARLAELGCVDPPLLVGHSDGGSIALAYATRYPVRALVAIAAHSYVEPICREAIVEMRRQPGIVFGLGRHHTHPAELFEAWSGVWVSDDFQTWDIRPELHAITAPTVIAQGTADEYATAAMVHHTVAAIGANATPHFIDGRGHLVHYEDPDPVVALAVDAWRRRANGSG